MVQVFIEAYGYHTETLYPYVDSFATESDIILYDPGRNNAETIASLPIRKQAFGLKAMLKILREEKVDTIHINTVSINLYAKTLKVWGKNIRLLLIPYIGKLFFGYKISGLVHESDQFYPVDAPVGFRHQLFQRLYGWLHIRFFETVYVLAPEMKAYLSKYADNIVLLSTSSLRKLSAPSKASTDKKKHLVWIGSVTSSRRNWKVLTEIDPEVLRVNDLCIDMVCDIREGEGPECLAILKKRGLAPYLKTRKYRPDDAELYAAVRDSCMVLCLFANDSYGQTKTSGARHIAIAFRKNIITQNGISKIVDTKGNITAESTNLNTLLHEAFRPPVTELT